MPPHTELQSKVLGDGQGTLLDTIDLCQQDTRGRPGPGIEEPAVFNRVMLGLAVDQPLEAILFPGILDRLSGRLGLMPPGVVDPPTSAREGVSQ